VSGRLKTEDEAQEAKLLGQALATLRMSRGLTQRHVAEKAGLTTARLCKIERGYNYPRQSILKRVLDGMGVTFAALHRAQELVQDPMGEDAEPLDAPEFTPEEAHKAALKLAQEAGRAVAHAALAFMEMGASGWGGRLPGNGAPRAARVVRRE
jgi:transcriptional regulator with XRE-family HTH domain